MRFRFEFLEMFIVVVCVYFLRGIALIAHRRSLFLNRFDLFSIEFPIFVRESAMDIS